MQLAQLAYCMGREPEHIQWPLRREREEKKEGSEAVDIMQVREPKHA